MNSKITVKEIKKGLESEILKKLIGKTVKMGDKLVEVHVNRLLGLRRQLSSKIFHLKWEGDKVPSGAIIDGEEISWTQHGMVTSREGKNFAVYERLIECGGKSGKEQQMLVFVN